ncbi:type II/IV secretion system ATPase subunit [Natrialbaceae archaeon A-CW1-1]
MKTAHMRGHLDDNEYLSKLFNPLAETIVFALDNLRGDLIEVESYNPQEHDSLVEYQPINSVVDSYWVNVPFAIAAIEYNEDSQEHLYRIIEPTLEEYEQELLERLLEDTLDALIYRTSTDSGGTSEEILQTQVRELLEEYAIQLSPESYYSIFYYLHREFLGYGKIDPLIHDPHIEDISCDGDNRPIFIYHDEYTNLKTDVSFNKEGLDDYVVKLAQEADEHINIGDPIVGATLPDGSRLELSLGTEVTPHGSAFTIRKYSEEPFTPIDLILNGTFDVNQMVYLWLAIENNKSLLFAGGTASGKTTSMNAVSMFIPPKTKIITIEDTRELELYHENWLSSLTREGLQSDREIDMYDLLRSALRHRPDYIIVGEVRGHEAVTLFQAMNTGHTTYSTMHADSVETVVNRLENEPIDVPRAMIQALDVVSIQHMTTIDNKRQRRNKSLIEIDGIDNRTGDLNYTVAYQWNPSSDEMNRSGGNLLQQIQKENGWTQKERRLEVKRRTEFLELLTQQEITEYDKFTALINEYYNDPKMALDKLKEGRSGVGQGDYS